MSCTASQYKDITFNKSMPKAKLEDICITHYLYLKIFIWSNSQNFTQKEYAGMVYVQNGRYSKGALDFCTKINQDFCAIIGAVLM